MAGLQGISAAGGQQFGATGTQNTSDYQVLRASIERGLQSGSATRQGDDIVMRNIGATLTLKPDGTIISQGSRQGSEPQVIRPDSN
jgi:hypothetical protein